MDTELAVECRRQQPNEVNHTTQMFESHSTFPITVNNTAHQLLPWKDQKNNRVECVRFVMTDDRAVIGIVSKHMRNASFVITCGISLPSKYEQLNKSRVRGGVSSAAVSVQNIASFRRRRGWRPFSVVLYRKWYFILMVTLSTWCLTDYRFGIFLANNTSASHVMHQR